VRLANNLVPICPKCQKMISESHYERHLRRCGTSHKHGPQSLYVPSATAQIEAPDRGITYGPPGTDHGRTNWKRLVVAGFVIFLLIGSLVVFFVLYALSVL
jgi:hypothetical protein